METEAYFSFRHLKVRVTTDKNTSNLLQVLRPCKLSVFILSVLIHHHSLNKHRPAWWIMRSLISDRCPSLIKHHFRQVYIQPTPKPLREPTWDPERLTTAQRMSGLWRPKEWLGRLMSSHKHFWSHEVPGLFVTQQWTTDTGVLHQRLTCALVLQTFPIIALLTDAFKLTRVCPTFAAGHSVTAVFPSLTEIRAVGHILLDKTPRR